MNTLYLNIDKFTKLYPNELVFANSLDEKMTWSELDKESNLLAQYFMANYSRQTAICVIGHKSPKFLSILIACIKSGNIFTPLDSELPKNRMASIISHFDTKLVISLSLDYDFAELNAQSFDTVKNESELISPILIAPTNINEILYFIFTSGSTGIPKGVPITLQNVQTFLNWTNSEFKFDEQSNLIFFNQAPFSFDLSVFEIYNALNFGHRIWSLAKKTSLRPNEFISKLSKSEINVWVSTPSFAEYCMSFEDFNLQQIKSLQSFVFCGETLHKTTAIKLLEKFPTARIFNLYGPTEATCATSLVEVTPEILKFETLPIAHKSTPFLSLISNDSSIEGEILISGDNVSPGYLNNPELNREKFTRTNNVQSYRTGDTGFYHQEYLFFKGRNDSQIKLNGYRIELDEIINTIKKIEGIKEASVLAMKDDQNQITHLVAFYNGDKAEQLVKAELKNKIPYYMIPSRLVKLDKFPLNVNGKVDSNQLRAIYHNLIG